MKIGVISDSHDNLKKVEEFLKVAEEENFDLVIHCGDFVSPFTVKLLISGLKCDFFGVFGNNDGEIVGLTSVSGGLIEKQPAEKEIDGNRFLIMHEPYFVEELALSGKFDFILYGHTHQAEKEVINGTIVVNPGELCGYLTGRSTFAILDTSENYAEVLKL